MSKTLKFSVAVLLLMAGALTAAAQSYHPRSPKKPLDPSRFDISFSWSGFPLHQAYCYVDGYPSSTIFYYDNEIALGYSTIEELYADKTGESYVLGNFGVTASYKLTNWFAISGEAGASVFWSEKYDARTLKKKDNNTGVALYILPSAKFLYVNRPVWRLYSSVGIGIGYYAGFDLMPADERAMGMVQLGLIGAEVGRKVYGLFEVGTGTIYDGVKIGVGYKF